MSEAIISLGDPQQLLVLFGPRDQHLRRIREELPVKISTRDSEVLITGDEKPVRQATEIMEQLKAMVQRRSSLTTEEVESVVSSVTGSAISIPLSPNIDVFEAGRNIKPKTAGQARYLNSMAANDLVFCVGPAGTGKTYLAVAMAVTALRHKEIKKIVLVRPAVEAGESLGFLPGDLHAKINPYLRPLLDALQEMMDYEQFREYLEKDIVEVIPLAYMRGRTLNDAFIILDEAQNSTISQMKMFLTRMGMGSKIVVSGDITQTDLPGNRTSGLDDAIIRLQGIEGYDVVYLSEADIVRHRLVQQIVMAYEKDSQDKGGRRRRK